MLCGQEGRYRGDNKKRHISQRPEAVGRVGWCTTRLKIWGRTHDSDESERVSDPRRSSIFPASAPVLSVLELLQFLVVRAVELVDLPVAQRPTVRGGFPWLLQHLRIFHGDLDDEVVHGRT